MITTAVCVVRAPKVDFEALSEGNGVLARAPRAVFACVHQRGEDAADSKRAVWANAVCRCGTIRVAARRRWGSGGAGATVRRMYARDCGIGLRN